jgi:hypothetical protein
MTRRHEDVPMSVLYWYLKVGEDVRNNLPTVRVAAYLSRRADATGAVGLDANGRPIAEPRIVAAVLGLGESTVYKALAALNRHGFIHWQKAKTPEKFVGVTGRVRLILNDEAA